MIGLFRKSRRVSKVLYSKRTRVQSFLARNNRHLARSEKEKRKILTRWFSIGRKEGRKTKTFVSGSSSFASRFLRHRSCIMTRISGAWCAVIAILSHRVSMVSIENRNFRHDPSISDRGPILFNSVYIYTYIPSIVRRASRERRSYVLRFLASLIHG